MISYTWRKFAAIAIATAILLASPWALSADAATKNAYQKKWGTFSTKTYSGTGDDVIVLSSAIKTGLVSATHDGASNFSVTSYSTTGAYNALWFNEIGAYSGKVEFGFYSFTAKTKSFEVSADGNWSIKIMEANKASAFKTSGSGSAILKYNKGAKAWRITHDGDSNFVVNQFCTSGNSKLVVNEIGSYSGKKLLLKGTCILAIKADGNWAFKK